MQGAVAERTRSAAWRLAGGWDGAPRGLLRDGNAHAPPAGGRTTFVGWSWSGLGELFSGGGWDPVARCALKSGAGAPVPPLGGAEAGASPGGETAPPRSPGGETGPAGSPDGRALGAVPGRGAGVDSGVAQRSEEGPAGDAGAAAEPSAGETGARAEPSAGAGWPALAAGDGSALPAAPAIGRSVWRLTESPHRGQKRSSLL